MQKHRHSSKKRPSHLVNRPAQRLTTTNALASLGPVVYAARADGLIKIGYTTDLVNRLKCLNARHDDLLAFTPAMSVADEAAVHQRLSGRAVRGKEWYATDDPAVLAVVNDMRDRLGMPALQANDLPTTRGGQR